VLRIMTINIVLNLPYRQPHVPGDVLRPFVGIAPSDLRPIDSLTEPPSALYLFVTIFVFHIVWV
jgi:hypothetical protein